MRRDTRPPVVSDFGSKRSAGFTIVELLIVIVVIAILAAITVVAFNGVQSRAASAAAQSNVTNAHKRVATYHAQNVSYPTSITDCPTPGATSLCLSAADGYSWRYRTSTAANQADVEVASMSDQQFFYRSRGEAIGGNEFLRYTDIAPFIDRYGLVRYKLTFNLRSANSSTDNTTHVYMQNGSGAKYGGLSTTVTVSDSFANYEILFTPSVSSAELTESWLAFYGTYSTGNIPIVHNVTLTRAF